MTQHTSHELINLLHVQLEREASELEARRKAIGALVNGHAPVIAKVEKIKRGAGIYTRTPASRAKQARKMRAYWRKKRREQK